MLEGKRGTISPKAIAMLSSPHARYPGSPDSYGYGLTIREHRGVRMLEHGGSRMGYGSSIRMAPDQRVAVIVVTNRSGANLPAAAEKALEFLLPFKDRPQPPAPEALAVTPQDIARVAGVYRNGDQKLEIVERAGKLLLLRGAAELPLVKRTANRYAQENGGAEYIAVPGADGRIEYLHAGSRSYARR